MGINRPAPKCHCRHAATATPPPRPRTADENRLIVTAATELLARLRERRDNLPDGI